MKHTSIRVQVIVLFSLILANFIAQIPYYFHLYYHPNNPLTLSRGTFLMLFVFVVFLLASIFLFRGKAWGYWLMLLFVTVEFLFYVWNTFGAVLHGYGWFFHLSNPDLLLKVVFAIGYVNLFAAGYFLGLLLLKRSHFFASQSGENSPTHYSVQ